MNTNLFFHGTSYENYKEIMKNGFADCKPLVWSCADEEVTYLYQLDKVIEADCREDSPFEDQVFFCLTRANENAQITASVQDSKTNKTAVFKIEIPEEFAEEVKSVMYPDESCLNSIDAGGMCIPSNLLNQFWKEGKIKVEVHFFRYYSRLGLFYIAGLWDNEYLDEIKWDMDKITLDAWKLVSENFECGLWEELLDAEEVEEEDN